MTPPGKQACGRGPTTHRASPPLTNWHAVMRVNGLDFNEALAAAKTW
ncbi:hypothetical protein HI113_02870 [Corallococcus exiguus]|nr:hypothetical protein [Corallococcus exiguus]NNB92856.1 hypothetical protein [Corallococcus exiguus]